MFSEELDTCFGCIFALLNTIPSTDEFPEISQHIIDCLKDIKDGNNLSSWITCLREDKKLVVPNCFSCQTPCGRSNEISLNSKTQMHRDQAMLVLNDLDAMSMDDILFRLNRVLYI